MAKKKLASPAPTVTATLPAPAPAPTAPANKMSFSDFIAELTGKVDPVRLAKAYSMLKAERFKLFAEAEADSLIGVVRSQSSEERVYSCRLTSTGSFSCCTQNLRTCGGLSGALCKHLLVLIVGLAKSGQLDNAAVAGWVKASRTQRPVLDKDVMTATFLKH